MGIGPLAAPVFTRYLSMGEKEISPGKISQ